MRIIKVARGLNDDVIVRYNDEYAILADNTVKRTDLADLPKDIKWESQRIFKLKATNQGLVQVVKLSENIYLSNDGRILAEDSEVRFNIIHQFTFVPPERS